MPSKLWPGWMIEPEYQRELDAAEWDCVAQMLEDQALHRENVRLGFEEDAA